MSSGQSQTISKGGKRRGPPRPTTARRNHAGLVISLALHGGLLAATYFTWHRMVEMTPESHAVPVELVVAEQTNVRAEAVGTSELGGAVHLRQAGAHSGATGAGCRRGGCAGG